MNSNYPSQRYNEGGPIQLPPRKKKNTGKVLLSVVIAIVLCAFGGIIFGIVAAGAKKASDDINNSVDLQPENVKAKVEITNCKPDQYGMVEIEYTLTNAGTDTGSFQVQFNVVTPKGDVRLAETHGAANKVPAGGIVKGSATAVMENPKNSKGAKCVIGDIQSF